MAVTRTFTGETPLLYPDLGLIAEPGQSYDLPAKDVPGDGLWQDPKTTSSTAAPSEKK